MSGSSIPWAWQRCLLVPKPATSIAVRRVVWVRSLFGDTVRSRYKRQLIRLNMKKKWPTRAGKEDSRPIFFCKRFSYNENALYIEQQQSPPVKSKPDHFGRCVHRW